ncbi:hypothetical protein JTE90_018039 [Oedothorax gibbosus]|uniref:Uncharacterized protein n=1 Tax=Oedothorax gibbosus TaxID=931172 RepID=A0AAV6TV58_9ARAC|nr:hypothetical protein JTE90_018039 [Oedothorax gibbosus]
MKINTWYAILIGSIVVLTRIDLAQAGNKPSSSARNIFKAPDQSDVSEVKLTSTPWVKEDFVPNIEDFKNSVFENLKKSPQVQKIWNVTTDCKTVRSIFFRIPVKFLTDLGHPYPQALANIISKAASLNNPMTMPIFFEVTAIKFAEVFLAYNLDIDNNDAAKKYVDFISSEIDKANLDDQESIWQSTYNSCALFAESYGFDLKVKIVEFMELFVNQLIVSSEKQK